MTVPHTPAMTMPVVGHLSDFDQQSGHWLERLLFNHRIAVVALCALLTVLMGWQAGRLTLNASFEKMIPIGHPYVVNYLKHQHELAGLGNAVRVVVEHRHGTIYDAAYMAKLKQISDEVFLIPGVDRSAMKSLWTPNTRWFGVTEDGVEGGPVVPERYAGSSSDLRELQENVERSGEIGQLVSLDARSSTLYMPLLDADAQGRPLDYARLADALEQVRGRHRDDVTAIHIVGFAKLVGDLIDGLREVMLFFGVAVVIAAAMVLAYTRCVRCTTLVVFSSLVAVLWQLGTLAALRLDLDPYSMLVPFLVFAIGMSHGAQKMNGILQDVGRGTHKLVAARYTFRRLFLAGLAALLADAVGFAVLLVIDIPVIRDLALTASIGVAALIVTNLILLPVLLSFSGVDPAAARRSLGRAGDAQDGHGAGARSAWRFLDRFTARRTAGLTVACAAVLALAGLAVGSRLQIGDLDPGAPELRADSRYNRDVAFLNEHYGASSDVLAVMVQTPDGACANYETQMRVDALEWSLRQLPGVESTQSLAQLSRRMMAGLNEGNPRWTELLPNQKMLNLVTSSAPRGLLNDGCSLLTIHVYLGDHTAQTLDRVVQHVEAFAKDNDSADARFLLAAGQAGIEAATNIVVRRAWHQMLLLVYGAVIALCFITFRSWRAVLCAVLPLMLTSILAEALMVVLGMGVKVATLPVIALGVGIGVDYALYVLSVVLAGMRRGESLPEAFHQALLFTGKVVMLTGLTLAAGVATWALSDIKFQADMGILLAFMFLWNMVGALVLLPALAHFLLPHADARTDRQSRRGVPRAVAAQAFSSSARISP